MKIDRLLAITVILLNRERISARELAERFEVNIRTIYRDIESINMAGIPIISYSGNNGGFGIMENYRISHQYLSLADMSSIIAALKGINSSLANREIDAAIEKIASLIPEYEKENFDRNYEQIALDVNPWGVTERTKDMIRFVNKAISARRKLYIRYLDSAGNLSERTVEPMTLVLKGYSWYLFSFCTEKNDFRIFKISRIRHLEETSEVFVRKAASYRDFIKDFFKPAGTLDIRLKINSELKNKMAEYMDGQFIEDLPGGYFEVSFSFPDDEWTESFILGLGEKAEVLEPVALREKIVMRISKMRVVYNI